MERETIEVTTPVGKHVLVLNTYITGREKRLLQNVYLEGNLNFDTEGKRVEGMKMDALVNKATDLAWRLVVASFDGKKDGVEGFNVVEAILDLQQKDYSFVLAKVNAVTGDEDFEKKS